MSAEYNFSWEPVVVDHVETQHRRIQTAIPCPGTADILGRLEAVESRSMQGQMPIVWDRAEDFSVFDRAGNQWIDFTSTIFVANVGHGNARVSEAIRSALDTPLLHSYAYVSEKRVEYIDRLIQFAKGDFDKAFLLSSGTEATEAALKLMRLYAEKKNKRRPGILCLEGNWHGRTMGAQLMSGNPDQAAWIGLRDPNIHHLPFPYPWDMGGRTGSEFFEEHLGRLIEGGLDPEQDLCGVMLETFQGWGALFYPNGFVEAIAEMCARYDILLTFDEMQSGFGRTGKRFGYEHYDVDPDLICCGKGMGSGMPLSGVLGRGDVMDLPDVGNMSSTHSANPLVCAAGLATLEELEEKSLVDAAADKGELLQKLLGGLQEKYPLLISHVTGKGLIAALLFRDLDALDTDVSLVSRICESCLRKGVLLVHTGRESIKLGPPLTITPEALAEGVSVIDEAIAGVLNGEDGL